MDPAWAFPGQVKVWEPETASERGGGESPQLFFPQEPSTTLVVMTWMCGVRAKEQHVRQNLPVIVHGKAPSVHLPSYTWGDSHSQVLAGWVAELLFHNRAVLLHMLPQQHVSLDYDAYKIVIAKCL